MKEHGRRARCPAARGSQENLPCAPALAEPRPRIIRSLRIDRGAPRTSLESIAGITGYADQEQLFGESRMNTEPRVASAFSRRTPLLALLLALGIGAPACGRQLNPVAQPDPAVQQVSAAGAEPPASPPPPIQTAVLPPAPVPATFDVAA